MKASCALPLDTETTRFYEDHLRRFGYDAKNTRELVRPTLEHLFSLARTGMAVNFLSRRAPTRSPGRLYLHPADVLQFAFELTPAVKLDHTYLPNDFTLCLYRTLPW